MLSLRKMLVLEENKEKKPVVKSDQDVSIVERRFILLSALIGGVSTVLTYLVVHLVIPFSLPFFFLVLCLGGLVGVLVFIIARRNSGSRLVSLLFVVLVGLIMPICLIQIVFLVFGNGD